MNNESLYMMLLRRLSIETGIPEKHIVGKKRDEEIIEARNMLRYAMFKNGINKRNIAILTGVTNATILSGLKRFKDLLDTEPKLRDKFETIFDNIEVAVKKPVYIIGKVTGQDYKECFRKFEKREKRLENAGYIVVNPMRIVPDGTLWHEAMRICLAAMVQCYAVSPLDDWTDSRGAKIEMHIAQELKMNVIYKI